MPAALTGAALLGVPAFLAAGLALFNLDDPLVEHGSLGAPASLGVAGLAAGLAGTVGPSWRTPPGGPTGGACPRSHSRRTAATLG